MVDEARIKAELLCWGLKPTEAAHQCYSESNPYATQKTGNIGLTLKFGDSVAFVSVTHKFCKKSPYELKKEGGKWALTKNGKRCCDIEVVRMPSWYAKKTKDGTPMSDVFLHEGTNFMHIAYQGCGYFQMCEECRFCSTGAKWKDIRPENVGETAAAAFAENPKYEAILGGGTRLGPDRSAIYQSQCLAQIRQRSKKVPVLVENAPPENDAFVQQMIDAGASAFSFNIEVWNDALRNEICPGKAKISKQRYLKVLEYANDQLGPDKTCSVIIGGLDKPESLLEGAEQLARMGVKPDVIPFKPWDGSAFENRQTTSPDEIVMIAEKVAGLMKDYGVNPWKNHGCIRCGACVVEDDYLKRLGVRP
jgi:ferredoxin